jgi:hypothetical protein
MISVADLLVDNRLPGNYFSSDIYSGVQADAVRLSVLLWHPPCVPTPPIYVTASSPFTNKVKGQFDN